MLTLVVARAKGGAIGKDGTIPWHAPEDLAFFQRETLGGALIMGRRTWESLPKRPLPRRLNIVVTSRRLEGEALFTSLDAAVPAARAAGHARIYSIGGAGIFSAHLPIADRLLVTEVDLEVAGADTFFPEFDPSEWVCAARIELRAAPPACVLYEYLRRR
ncbi:dihydrofolate reductase [Cereibacter sediminicola]|uniref:dihydrofolate reductase n=1 Tax=Cereibacter sediminicola TaxID=2584941 RepID=UPI0011A74A9F|nr:dihydrofolate reductase [Cereibacter sediminicola]